MLYTALARGAALRRERHSCATAAVLVLLAALATAVGGSPGDGPFTSAFDHPEVAERQEGPCIPVPSEYDGKTISNLPCEDVVVDLPFELKFDGSQIGVPDRYGRSTGMRMYMPSTNKQPPFVPQRITVQGTQQRIRLIGMPGNWEWDNRVRNALGVGLPVPSRSIKMEVTVKMPNTDGTARERFCLYVGVNDQEFVWTCILRQNNGYRVHLHSEKGNKQVTRRTARGVQLGSDRMITLRMDILPADSEIKASYQVTDGEMQEFAMISVDPYTLNADQAATDLTLGSRTMGGFAGLRDPKHKAPTFFVRHFSVDELFPSQNPGTGEAQVDFTTWRVPGVKQPTSNVWAGGKLWAAGVDGQVYMIEFNAARTAVVAQRTFHPIGERMLTGITVDPEFSANHCFWLSHSSGGARNTGVANSGKVTKVCGSELDSVTDVIWGLPRAIANHATNNLFFKDNLLYLAIGGNSGTGAMNTYEKSFRGRPEQRMSASLARFPVFEPDFDGDCTPTQDPDEMDASGIAEKIDPTCDFELYATGMRNVFDCTFHSNGHLYCGDNAITSWGTFPVLPPGYTEGDACDGIVTGDDLDSHNPGPRHDPIYKVKQGAYYGHPNPSRNECVMGAGNPTNKIDAKIPFIPVADNQTRAWDVFRYPVGTQPQSNFDAPILSFGKNRSPDGIIEYMSSKMCGKLQNQLLVTWYSVEPQIRRLELDEAGDIKDDGTLPRSTVETGGTAMGAPIGISEDDEGNLFVSEFTGAAIVVFNPVPQSCSRRTAANAPPQLDGAASVADGTQLYAFGGRRGARATAEAHVYDATSDTWTSLRDLPEAVADASAVVTADGKVLIVGGEKADGTVSARVWAFNPTTGDYTARASLPEARTGAVAALQQEVPVVVGGLGQDGGLPMAGTLRLGDSGTWEARADSREPRAYAAGAVGADGKLLICGGQVARGISRVPTQSCERFDGAQWSLAAPMGEARSHLAFFAHGTRFVAKGGYMEDGSISDSIEVLDPEAGKWAYVGTMRTGRSGAVHGALGGEMFTFSGRTESDLTRRGDAVHIN